MNIFELSAKITADTSDFDSKVGSMVSSGVKKFAALTTAAAAATTAFVGKAVQTGADFDKAMSQVQATMLKSNEQMRNEVGKSSSAYGEFEGNLRDFAQFLGQNTVFSATQAAEALNFMALAGYSTQESMDMLPNVLSLAAAGGFDLARASDMVTDTQTAFGMSAKRTTQLVDEMAKTASISNTSVEQMGDAFLVVGGLAQELNGGFVELADGTQAPVDGIQELEIALGAMANAGVKGSEAGTHMRNMLLKLASPTEAGTLALEEMGVKVFDATGKMRSLSDIFGDLNKELSSMDQEAKLNVISDLFNTRDLASAEALLAAIDQDWDEIGEGILNAGGAAAQMSEIQLDNLKGDVTLAKSAFEALQIAISDEVTPSIRNFVQKGTEWIQKLTNWVKNGGLREAIDKIREAWDKIRDALSPLIEKFKEVFATMSEGNVAGEAFSAIVDVIAGVLRVVSEVLATLVGWIAQFITWITSGSTSAEIFKTILVAVVAGIVALIAVFKGIMIIQQVIMMVQMLGSVFSFLAANPIILVIAAIAAVVAALVYLYNHNEAFKEKVDAIWQAITGFFEKAAEIIKGVWEAVVEFFKGAWEAIKLVWDGVSEYFRLRWESIKEIFSVVGKVLTGDFSGAWEGIKGIVSQWAGYFSGVWNAISGVFSGVVSWFGNVFGSAAQAIHNAFSGIGNFFSSLWQGITSTISGIVSALIDYFKQAWENLSNIDWKNVGSNIITGIVNGINNFGHYIWDTLHSWASNAWENVKSFFRIGSPSKLMADTIGKWLPLGVAEGIESEGDSVSDALQDVLNPDNMDLDYSIQPSYGVGNGVEDAEDGIGQLVPITINIYPTESQDAQDIAREVERYLTIWQRQKKAVFA